MASKSRDVILAKVTRAIHTPTRCYSMEILGSPSSQISQGASPSTPPASIRGEIPAGRNFPPVHPTPEPAIVPVHAPTPPPQYKEYEETPVGPPEDCVRDLEVAAPLGEHYTPGETANDHDPRKNSMFAFLCTKKGILLLVVFTNAAILAALLGGVLGSRGVTRASSNDSSSGSNTGSTPLSTSTMEERPIKVSSYSPSISSPSPSINNGFTAISPQYTIGTASPAISCEEYCKLRRR